MSCDTFSVIRYVFSPEFRLFSAQNEENNTLFAHDSTTRDASEDDSDDANDGTIAVVF